MFHLFISLFGSCVFVFLQQRLGFWGSVFIQDVWTSIVFHINTWLRRGGDRDKIIVAATPRVFAAVEAAATQLFSTFVRRRRIAEVRL
jgi:hypothetical protein